MHGQMCRRPAVGGWLHATGPAATMHGTSELGRRTARRGPWMGLGTESGLRGRERERHERKGRLGLQPSWRQSNGVLCLLWTGWLANHEKAREVGEQVTKIS